MPSDSDDGWDDLAGSWNEGDHDDPWEGIAPVDEGTETVEPVDPGDLTVDVGEPDDLAALLGNSITSDAVDDIDPGDDALLPAGGTDGADDDWVDPPTPVLVGATHFDAVLGDDTDNVETDEAGAGDAEHRDDAAGDEGTGAAEPWQPPVYSEIFGGDLEAGDDVDALGVVAADGGPWVDPDVLGADDPAHLNVGGLGLADELGVIADADADAGVGDGSGVAAGLWEVLVEVDDPDAREMARAALVLLGEGDER